MMSEDAQSRGTQHIEEPDIPPKHNSRPESLTQDHQPEISHSSEDERSQPSQALQHQPKELPGRVAGVESIHDAGNDITEEVIIEVHVPLPERPWEYLLVSEEETVQAVIEEIDHPEDELWYRVKFEDVREDDVSFESLLSLPKGPAALETFNNGEADRDPLEESSEQSDMPSKSKKRTLIRFGSGSLHNRGEQLSESDDEIDVAYGIKRQRVGENRTSFLNAHITRKNPLDKGHELLSTLSDEGSSDEPRESRFRLRRSTRNPRPSYANQGLYDNNSGLDNSGTSKRRDSGKSADSEDFKEHPGYKYESNDDILYYAPKSRLKRSDMGRGRGRPRKYGARISQVRQGRNTLNSRNKYSSSSDDRPEPTRRSDRTNKTTKNMKEHGEDEEIFADEMAADKKHQVITVREVFKPLPLNSHFRVIHNKHCDICGGYGNNSNKGPSPLIYCQGCSISIHRACLGARSVREHIVTKVAEQDFVMQCRRCVGVATKKDFIAPRLDICQGCKLPGEACEAFSRRRTPKQEEKLREDNQGIDPITRVDPALLNNPAIILFRCNICHRGFHFEHLESLSEDASDVDSVEDIRDLRYAEYSQTWKCKDCQGVPGKVQTLVAWRPSNIDNYIPGQPLDMVSDDDKEYLIKWEDRSYFRCTWMSGAWVWGVTAPTMRNAFARRNEGTNSHPKMNEDDAIPEEFLRMEIVLDVKYSSRVNTHTEEIDKARVTEVEEVYVKFQGLGYDEVVWERPPSPSETERWNDFVTAYKEYVIGKYFKQPPPKIKERIQEYRELDFKKKIVLQTQPAYLTGGQMMEYQMEGLNWLLYNYHQGKNVILADEMGLGKTIQVIAAIATLIKERPKCWPFLIVVPNSTCPNWRREIKKWAPSLRVVAYYGLRKARDVAMDYELYPDGSTDMRAHVVVTSYDAPVDDHSKSFFHKVKWAGLIVDEGQRLKNDQNLLYRALSALKVPFRVLLTGTPLQNNKRELFNLVQFLDTTLNAAQLDEKYANLTNEALAELHDLIRPFFLRRTKVQVLKFLPPMAQVIVPVTMSVVQKKLYKSILARSPELIQSIFVKDQAQLRPTDRGNLNNILIQLRKVLCHPFLYSQAIEERTASQTISYRNLVDASAKLQLLEILLPKLHERGHRVLIFSQFLMQLDIVEDFLDGLGLGFQRLDGGVGALEKQKRIDAFNSPDSTLFAFLLSTRAGGVGINLATADTVIIMDPDFNPHQDIQALSRAHRIGQKKKVLFFQLMTKASAEEKIVQIGRKKMALDHVLIESMDLDDETGVDLHSILQHGAQALFNDDEKNDIRYDSASVDKLLDRSQVENTGIGDDKSAESQFSYARIWANNIGTLTEDISDANSDASGPDLSVWDKILKQREADAAKEAAVQQKLFGRGRRMRQNVDYQSSNLELEDLGPSPEKSRTVQRVDGDSDTEFAGRIESEVDEDRHSVASAAEYVDVSVMKVRKGTDTPEPTKIRQVGQFQRAKIAKPVHSRTVAEAGEEGRTQTSLEDEAIPSRYCHACGETHITGFCALKRTGVEHCGLCGIAHFSGSQNCTNLKSEKQVRLMLDALKTSTESREDIELARTQLRLRIHDLVQEKRLRRASLLSAAGNIQQPSSMAT